tara:strand:- start:76153 stop:76485 length:333 start_codon:yes stop_codon:yes gene_type:complete
MKNKYIKTFNNITNESVMDLNNDYDINVDNMLDISTDKEDDKFKIESSEFYSESTEDYISKNILVWENDEPWHIYQIFSMTDGKFVLEIEDAEGDINYYYSNDLEELKNK